MMMLLRFATFSLALTASFAAVAAAGSEARVLVVLTCGLVRIKGGVSVAGTDTILCVMVPGKQLTVLRSAAVV